MLLETPPRTRRKRGIDEEKAKAIRNTSAYAEKTGQISKQEIILWKHLRVRGENRIIDMGGQKEVETPPRTRRKQICAFEICAFERNTSAYAEKTITTNPMIMNGRKHLRVRGENKEGYRPGYSRKETPPRTRRKLRYFDRPKI